MLRDFRLHDTSHDNDDVVELAATRPAFPSRPSIVTKRRSAPFLAEQRELVCLRITADD